MELTKMKNIGSTMERKLKSIGIHDAEKLMEVGSKDAYICLKEFYPATCLVHLYALQGAIDDIEYNRLPPDTVKDLKEFVKD